MLASASASATGGALLFGQQGDRAQGGALVVIVRDHGPGISAENQKKLFKSIVQFSPEKTQGM